ncbi:TraG/VirB4 family ATPase [Chryseobacterium sp. CT-SW4]|uniref:TraG/VirB4 family ATPase n=1 Tax=Chryseobacterium sp. SW-1 TaxID=3157343 RepID=UPI003B025BC0
MKQKVFKKSFIGFDLANVYNTDYDTLIGNYGNPIIGIKIKNVVTQYSADAELYQKYHSVFNQLVNILGEGHIFQKLDIFDKRIYKAEENKEYLQKKYSEHFDGRIFKVIETLLIFTHYIDNSKKKGDYKHSEKKYADFRERIEKIFLVLKDNDFDPVFMMKEDWENYYYSYLNMDFSSEYKYLNNMQSYDSHLEVNNQAVRIIDFIDVEDIQLPNTVTPYSTLGGNSSASKNTAVDNFSFLSDLQEYNCFIYNQVIAIPIQNDRNKDLQLKKNRHEGFKSDPANIILADEIEELLTNIAKDNQLITDAYFGIILSCKDREQLDKTSSMIESKLFQKGIITSKQSYNQFELFRSYIPGNINELKSYNYFTSTSEASLCFFFKESYPVDEKSNIYLRFTDRQGVPLKVDLCDLPRETGRINNRNKFVLGPSGSGKSFLMNNIVEQYLTYNYDVVIVDTGDSYSGTCKYYNGKYIQYKEDDPISMNPFNVAEAEFNIEKTEFLVNLIFLIWQGADESMSTTQKSILDNTLLSYYSQFFNSGKDWYYSKTTDELILFLGRFNYYEDDIVSEFNSTFESKTDSHYTVLGIPMNASRDDVKKAFRKKSIMYHPDTNVNNEDFNEDHYEAELQKVYKAYEVLNDDEKRREYDETQLIVMQSTEVLRKPRINSEEWKEEFRKYVIAKIEDIDKKFKVKELSFNSFYEYCEIFLPVYLNHKKHSINEAEFNIRTFLHVLKDFYKGGRYETTLNKEADKSLFYEPFIVFEIDNVKDNPKLFPIVTLIIMDTFIQKMRLREDRRKALIIEEAWKAIASKLMGGYILYLYKTVRKFWGEAIVVTQELNDIIGNAVVKDSIISNSDTFILLDQTKFKDNFTEIAALLSLNEVEQSKIFTVNNLNNKANRAPLKEFYLKRGSTGEVYGNEVSIAQYLTYTTEKPEKKAVEIYVKRFGNYQEALEEFISHIALFKGKMKDLVTMVNIYNKPIDKRIFEYYKNLAGMSKKIDLGKYIKEQLEDQECTIEELIA